MPDNIYNIVKKANLYKDEPQKTFWEYIIKDKKLKITEGYRDEY